MIKISATKLSKMSLNDMLYQLNSLLSAMIIADAFNAHDSRHSVLQPPFTRGYSVKCTKYTKSLDYICNTLHTL